MQEYASEGNSTRPASILALALAALLLTSMAECAPDYRKVVQASEILAKIERGEPVNYDGVIVEGDLDLSELKLPSEYVERTESEIQWWGLAEEVKVIESRININNSEIRGNVALGNNIFQEQVNFENTDFTGAAYFSGSNFREGAKFSGAEFSGEYALFYGAEFSGGVAEFSGAKFTGGDAEYPFADFHGSKFLGGDTFFSDVDPSGGDIYSFSFADFRGVKFSGGNTFFDNALFSGGCADFSNAEFSGGDAFFYRAEFSGGDADFTGSKFSGGYAFFSEANFSGGDAFFSYAEFSGGFADFSDAVFSGGDAIFSLAEFSGGYDYYQFASFSNVTFSGGDAKFYGAVFKEPVTFTDSTFERNASITYARFGDRAYFIDATFNGSADFRETQFSGNAYFENSTFGSDLDLTRTGFIRLFLPWESVDGHQLCVSDDDAYLALMRNYVNLGWFEDSNNCYYEYRNKLRMSEPFSFEKIKDTLEWILYGYGMKPLRIGGWIVSLIIGFGLVFSYFGNIKKYIREEHVENSTDETTGGSKSEAAEIKTVFKRGEISFIDPFLFSFIIVTFTSGFVSFLYPTIEYRAEKNKVLIIMVVVERFLGYVFLALLITAISKTYLIR